jgi:hypothetical protein
MFCLSTSYDLKVTMYVITPNLLYVRTHLLYYIYNIWISDDRLVITSHWRKSLEKANCAKYLHNMYLPQVNMYISFLLELTTMFFSKFARKQSNNELY